MGLLVVVVLRERALLVALDIGDDAANDIRGRARRSAYLVALNINCSRHHAASWRRVRE